MAKARETSQRESPPRSANWKAPWALRRSDMGTTNTTAVAIDTSINLAGRHVGEEVTIKGWLYNLRESGKLLFPIFRVGTGLIQGVVPKNAVSPELFDRIKGLTQEST